MTMGSSSGASDDRTLADEYGQRVQRLRMAIQGYPLDEATRQGYLNQVSRAIGAAQDQVAPGRHWTELTPAQERQTMQTAIVTIREDIRTRRNRGEIDATIEAELLTILGQVPELAGQGSLGFQLVAKVRGSEEAVRQVAQRLTPQLRQVLDMGTGVVLDGEITFTAVPAVS